MTPLQREILDESRSRIAEMEAALKQCRTREEREACRRAYARLGRCMQDMIGQKHGLPGMLWRAPD